MAAAGGEGSVSPTRIDVVRLMYPMGAVQPPMSNTQIELFRAQCPPTNTQPHRGCIVIQPKLTTTLPPSLLHPLFSVPTLSDDQPTAHKGFVQCQLHWWRSLRHSPQHRPRVFAPYLMNYSRDVINPIEESFN